MTYVVVKKENYAAGQSIAAVVISAAKRVVAYLTTARMVQKERRQLKTLPPHILRDIGITDADIARETARDFWDVPGNRF